MVDGHIEMAWCDAMVEKTSNKLAFQHRRVAAMPKSDPARAEQMLILASMRLNASAARLNRELISFEASYGAS